MAAFKTKDLHWLVRYARHCHLKLDPSVPEAHAIRSRFTPPAWRLLCRSERACFTPILRNRQLRFYSLVQYCQSLVTNGFQVAPNPELLNYLIQSSYLFFDRQPQVPDGKDKMTLLRLAMHHGAVSKGEFHRVSGWLHWASGIVSTGMTWSSVLHRANEWHLRQQVVNHHAGAENAGEADQADEVRGWHFACASLAWRGYKIVPLASHMDLWDEGQAMSHCLYQLRHLCSRSDRPSRFFSIRKNGHRHATLELVLERPHTRMKGPDRIYGQWHLQDCRLSHNRLPQEALVKMLSDFGWHYNILSQRPARRPKAMEASGTSGIRIISSMNPHQDAARGVDIAELVQAQWWVRPQGAPVYVQDGEDFEF